ncbi:MAG: type II toxin-antitoxin system death-on-curing family toxin [Rhodobacteraceae bacterium]|nr:type II toxin-antitoxin system death-on-curing family toxin [Paracoccaceae bacterium]
MSRHYRVTLQDVIDAHETALSYGGGRRGVISRDVILSAIGRPYSGYYRTIDAKAAALLESLVRNHGFVDANKRTALIVTNLMIERSGYILLVPRSERIDNMVVNVAEGRLDVQSIRGWFGSRLLRI